MEKQSRQARREQARADEGDGQRGKRSGVAVANAKRAGAASDKAKQRAARKQNQGAEMRAGTKARSRVNKQEQERAQTAQSTEGEK